MLIPFLILTTGLVYLAHNDKSYKGGTRSISRG